MNQGALRQQDDPTALDVPAWPWLRALLGLVLAVLLLAAHALPQLI